MSAVVFAIATPVSKPAWFVTNGKSKLHVQELIENKLEAVLGWQKRGIGALVEAVGVVDSGAKLTATVAVPAPGKFWAVFEM